MAAQKERSKLTEKSNSKTRITSKVATHFARNFHQTSYSIRGIQISQFESQKMKECSKRTFEDEKSNHHAIKLKISPDIRNYTSKC